MEERRRFWGVVFYLGKGFLGDGGQVVDWYLVGEL